MRYSFTPVLIEKRQGFTPGLLWRDTEFFVDSVSTSANCENRSDLSSISCGGESFLHCHEPRCAAADGNGPAHWLLHVDGGDPDPSSPGHSFCVHHSKCQVVRDSSARRGYLDGDT